MKAPIERVLLTEDEAAEALGVSVRFFASLRSVRWMPKPIQLGPRMLRWSRTELEAAMANAPRAVEPAPEPESLAAARRARIEQLKGDAP